MVGLIFKLVVRDLLLLSHLSMDKDMLYELVHTKGQKNVTCPPEIQNMYIFSFDLTQTPLDLSFFDLS